MIGCYGGTDDENYKSFQYSDGKIGVIALCADNSRSYDHIDIYNITNGENLDRYTWKVGSIKEIKSDKFEVTEVFSCQEMK